jgi:hypothetical protein
MCYFVYLYECNAYPYNLSYSIAMNYVPFKYLFVKIKCVHLEIIIREVNLYVLPDYHFTFNNRICIHVIL